jgi:hypothetical protein
MALVALVAACGFHSGTARDGGGADDAPPDARLCFGSFVEICFNSAANVPTGPLALPELPTTEINTESSTMCDPNNRQAATYCVVAGAGFVLPANRTIRAYGSKPLVLLSIGPADLAGVIDVSSRRDTDVKARGAGADPTDGCAGASPAMAAGGGFGGSFGGKGGNGEQVGSTMGGTSAGVAAAPTTLRGGCPGGDGMMAGASRTLGGSGGGAVAVIATTIQLDGKINASGAGGPGGDLISTGGGGGGAGGMIALDAASITGNGMLFANGGGGGQGGSFATNGAGQDGRESTGPLVVGAGGRTGTTTGGTGGDGASGTISKDGLPAQTTGLSGNAGGGAGGGGAGFIRAHGITNNIAPASTDL